MKKLSTSEMNKLVSEAIKGDRHAFSLIYRHTFEAQYYRSLSMLKDSSLAEEAVQTAYAKALENLSSLTAPEGFLSWLGSITYHCCVDIIRRNKEQARQTPLDSRLLLLPDNKNEEDTPLNNVINREKGDLLLNTISTLSDTHKTVIVLRYYKELPLKDIADIMNCSTGTIKSRLHYAHKELRTKLKEQGCTGFNTAFGLSTLLTKVLSNRELEECRPEENSHNKVKTAFYCGMLSCAMMAGLLHVPRPTIADIEIVDPHIYTSSGQNLIIRTDGTDPDEVILLYENDREASARRLDLGTYSVKAMENGELRIRLIKHGMAADQKKIKIDHIDQSPPELTEYNRFDHELMVTAYDGRSGLDFSKTRAETSSGSKVSILNIDKKKGTIRLPYSGAAVYLTLADHAGNRIVYCIEENRIFPESKKASAPANR